MAINGSSRRVLVRRTCCTGWRAWRSPVALLFPLLLLLSLASQPIGAAAASTPTPTPTPPTSASGHERQRTAGGMLRSAMELEDEAVAAADRQWTARQRAHMLAGTSEPLTLKVMNDSQRDGAMCLDGSPPAYYWRRGPVRKWIIHLEGAGWCTSEAECKKWAQDQSADSRGSSNHWERYLLDATGILSSDADVNPGFYHYNIAFIKSCDGASFAGDINGPAFRNPNIYFRGTRNLRAALLHLGEQGLSTASHLIVTGCGAGALGVFAHLESIRAFFPSVTVVGLPDSGYYIDVPTYRGGQHLQPRMQWMFHNQQLRFGLSDKCIGSKAPGHTWECVYPPTMLPYISTPIFISQSLYDFDQLRSTLQLDNPWLPNDCLKFMSLGTDDHCTASMTASIENLARTVNNTIAQFMFAAARPGNAAFLPSCLYQCPSLNQWAWTGTKVKVNGTTSISLQEAFSAWFFKRPVANGFYSDVSWHERVPRGFNPTCTAV